MWHAYFFCSGTVGRPEVDLDIYIGYLLEDESLVTCSFQVPG
jgi:hypothetical protein